MQEHIMTSISAEGLHGAEHNIYIVTCSTASGLHGGYMEPSYMQQSRGLARWLEGKHRAYTQQICKL